MLFSSWAEKNELGVPYRPGTRATVWHAHTFRLEDGMIVEHWPVREIWDAVRQFSAPALSESLAAVGKGEYIKSRQLH